MKLSDYRVEAGIYKVGDYTIYFQGDRSWTVRCPLDSIIEWFPTLRTAIAFAEQLSRRQP